MTKVIECKKVLRDAIKAEIKKVEEMQEGLYVASNNTESYFYSNHDGRTYILRVLNDDLYLATRYNRQLKKINGKAWQKIEPGEIKEELLDPKKFRRVDGNFTPEEMNLEECTTFRMDLHNDYNDWYRNRIRRCVRLYGERAMMFTDRETNEMYIDNLRSFSKKVQGTVTTEDMAFLRKAMEEKYTQLLEVYGRELEVDGYTDITEMDLTNYIEVEFEKDTTKGMLLKALLNRIKVKGNLDTKMLAFDRTVERLFEGVDAFKEELAKMAEDKILVNGEDTYRILTGYKETIRDNGKHDFELLFNTDFIEAIREEGK